MTKNERINEIKIGATLEEAREQLIKAQMDFAGISQNIEAVIANLEMAHGKILKGGVSDVDTN